MHIDDAKIKTAIHKYQISRSPDLFQELRDHLSNYIYHYPRKTFRANHDDAMTFYVAVLERLERIVLGYERTDYLFRTWFTVVLRNAYFDLTRKNTRTKRESIREISYEIAENVISYRPLEKKDSALTAVTNAIEKEITRAFVLRDALIFRMHYLELFHERVLSPLCVYFAIDLSRALRIYEDARAEYFPRYAEALRLNDQITLINRKIVYFKTHAPANVDALKIRKDRYQIRLNKIALVVPYRYLARLFKTSANAVTKVTQKIKRFLNEHCLFWEQV